MGTQVTVLGASGYTGGELLRLLAGHPAAAVAAAGANARAGVPIDAAHPHLTGTNRTALVDLETAAATSADVCFSCLPAGALAPLASRVAAPLLIDLADDFRSDPDWIYGLTEFVRPSLAGATRIANPGCYPTAALLCLLPFALAGAIEGPVVIDAISGLSGAGRGLEDHLMLASAEGNVTAYGPTTHRHVPEIEGQLAALGGLETKISFTPHLAPTARGLLVTARAAPKAPLADGDVRAILDDAYSSEPFVTVVSGWPATKPVRGTNRAHIAARVDERTGWLICSAAIDNLGKGAAGQALQNANIALGFEEEAGLDAWGVWP